MSGPGRADKGFGLEQTGREQTGLEQNRAGLVGRRDLGLGRRTLLRALVVVPYALLGAAVLALALGVVDRSGSGPSQLMAQLAALAVFLLVAPEPKARFDLRQAAGYLAAPAGVGAGAALLVASSADVHLGRPLTFAEEHLYLLARYNPVSLALALALPAVVCAPLLGVRRLSAQLEWQLGATWLGGWLAVWSLGLDVALDDGPRVFLCVLGFVPLGAGSYLADRWLLRGEPLARSQPLRDSLGTPARVLGVGLVLGLVFANGHAVVGAAAQRPFLRPEPAPAVEAALLACAERLEAHAAKRGAYPASLTELDGVDPDVAAGVLDGYVLRYVCLKSRWALAADPTPLRPPGSAHYQLSRELGLEITPQAQALYPR